MNENENMLLSVEYLSAGYGKKQVLFDVNLNVVRNEVLHITGGNGSGKSTLLKVIYGLVPPWDSRTCIRYQKTPDSPQENLGEPSDNLAKGIAYLPQKKSVFDDLTLSEALRLSEHMAQKSSVHGHIEEVLEIIPSLKPLLVRKPDRMSGGERQMSALGMLLLHRPKLLLLDEPLAGLDTRHSNEIEKVLEDMHINHGVTLVIVEHRRLHNPKLITREATLNLGKLVSNH